MALGAATTGDVGGQLDTQVKSQSPLRGSQDPTRARRHPHPRLRRVGSCFQGTSLEVAPCELGNWPLLTLDAPGPGPGPAHLAAAAAPTPCGALGLQGALTLGSASLSQGPPDLPPAQLRPVAPTLALGLTLFPPRDPPALRGPHASCDTRRASSRMPAPRPMLLGLLAPCSESAPFALPLSRPVALSPLGSPGGRRRLLTVASLAAAPPGQRLVCRPHCRGPRTAAAYSRPPTRVSERVCNGRPCHHRPRRR
nr:translation initiation factor IF-2-like isoform X7 [Equus caballus]